jgi:hypothetical protein
MIGVKKRVRQSEPRDQRRDQKREPHDQQRERRDQRRYPLARLSGRGKTGLASVCYPWSISL